jgi:hypothetical protein
MATSDPKHPKVEMTNIENLKITSAKGGVKISFDLKAPGPEILKLIWMSGTAQAMNATIESPQAEMDMKLTVFDIKTGEVKG